MALLQHLAEKIGLRTYQVSIEKMEDIEMAFVMKKGSTSQYVDTAAYLEKLNGK